MDRLQEKHSLYVKLGILFGPLLRLTEHPDQYDDQERAETLARFFTEYPILNNEFERFCKGQPGHFYAVECHKFQSALLDVRSRLIAGEQISGVISPQLELTQAALDAVPVPRTSVILEAGSPFTAYCRLRELCEADATVTLMWLDPYMSASLFHRYLARIRPTVPITLVTSEPGPHASQRNRDRWVEFMDVSRLFAQERGPALYRLVLQANLHDRWVVFDSKRVYALGGSAKDAADKDYFTISPVESSPTNLQRVQAHIDSGAELFGPSTPAHA